MAFGPDVQLASGMPAGIFGLSHEQLLQSEWVEDDIMTVKCELEVRPSDDPMRLCVQPKIDVPPATIGDNLLHFLMESTSSDVTFIVEGAPIKAHSQILSARSEVFSRQFNGYMRESVSKEVVVEDCDVATFKALLTFVYTDDLDCMETLVHACAGGGSESGRTDSGRIGAASSGGIATDPMASARTSLLQNVLAVSHKYQLSRLRLWCEQQLCVCITVNEACSVLCKAHLYEAKQLMESCLTFIKEHFEEVMATPTFGRLATEWPEVMLALSVFVAGVSESRAAAVINTQRPALGSKRKRDE